LNVCTVRGVVPAQRAPGVIRLGAGEGVGKRASSAAVGFPDDLDIFLVLSTDGSTGYVIERPRQRRLSPACRMALLSIQ